MLSADANRLTSGNVVKNLIRFAIPFLAANFLVSLYGAADVLIVSYFADSAALAATATGAQAVFTLMALAIGLAMGGTVLIGQYFGAKKEKDVLETISTVFSLFGMVSLVCAGLMLWLAGPITDWLKTPAEAWTGTYHYILICGGGLIFTFAYESIGAVLRGLGDSKNPLKFVAIACAINVILDVLFVGGFHWGASGAAAATVIAQACSVIFGILYLRRRKFIFDYKLKNFHLFPQKAKAILKLSIPTAIQQTIVFMSYTIMTVAVNKLGVIESAVLGITNRIDGFLIMPALAFGASISVMAAQNMGAGEAGRAKKTFYTGFLLSLAFAIPSFWLMYDWPQGLMHLASSDESIINSGKIFMFAYSPDCLFMAYIFCVHGFFNGCGRTTFTMGNNILSSVLRIYLILTAVDIFDVGFSMPVATLLQAVVAVIYFKTGRWKQSLIGVRERGI